MWLLNYKVEHSSTKAGNRNFNLCENCNATMPLLLPWLSKLGRFVCCQFNITFIFSHFFLWEGTASKELHKVTSEGRGPFHFHCSRPLWLSKIRQEPIHLPSKVTMKRLSSCLRCKQSGHRMMWLMQPGEEGRLNRLMALSLKDCPINKVWNMRTNITNMPPNDREFLHSSIFHQSNCLAITRQ